MDTAFESRITGENPRAIIQRSSRYRSGHRIAPHWHARAQFLFAIQGTMTVRTERRAWIVPPSRALWVPARAVHEVQAHGDVEMRSLYVSVAHTGGMPESCVVLEVTPLLRELVVRASQLPIHYDEAGEDGLLMRLLMVEMRRVPACPLDLPLAQSADLRALCEDILEGLSAGCATHKALEVSPRTLYRRFLRETGISFARWKHQARLLEAIRRLAGGASVTSVALDLGYESASAFSTMFRRSLGVSPRQFVRADGAR